MDSKPKSRVGRKARKPGATMTRLDLALEIHARKKGKISIREAHENVQLMIECMLEALVDGRYIEFRDFGTFETVEREERVGRNPRRPQDTYVIPKRKTIRFKPSRSVVQSIAERVAAEKEGE